MTDQPGQPRSDRGPSPIILVAVLVVLMIVLTVVAAGVARSVVGRAARERLDPRSAAAWRQSIDACRPTPSRSSVAAACSRPAPSVGLSTDGSWRPWEWSTPLFGWSPIGSFGERAGQGDPVAVEQGIKYLVPGCPPRRGRRILGARKAVQEAGDIQEAGGTPGKPGPSAPRAIRGWSVSTGALEANGHVREPKRLHQRTERRAGVLLCPGA